MGQHEMAVVASLWLGASVLAAAWVVWDLTGGGRHQKMAVMAFVWPLTMLYWGPVGLAFYLAFGRAEQGATKGPREHGEKPHASPMWRAAFLGATHCGAGCALGDFIGEWLAYGFAFTVAGSKLGGKLLLAFVLAYVIGVAFQYFSIAPMRGLGLRAGVVAAVKADTLSLVAYEIGMFAFMIAFAHVFPGLRPVDALYWVLMQVAMIAGFLTTWPVNGWLIRRGMKEKM